MLLLSSSQRRSDRENRGSIGRVKRWWRSEEGDVIRIDVEKQRSRKRKSLIVVCSFSRRDRDGEGEEIIVIDCSVLIV